MSQATPEVLKRHWERTRSLTIVVLCIWFVFSFVVHWFASSLNAYSFLHFPLGYYFAVQGSLAIFVILIFVQNKMQDTIDDEAGLSGREDI